MSSGMVVIHLACMVQRWGGTNFFYVFPLFIHHELLQELTCYHIVVFHFFLHHLLPCFRACPFLSTSFHVLATQVFTLINVWSSEFSPSGQHQFFHSLDLLLLTCLIHINCIFHSLPAASTSSSISFLLLNLWSLGFSHMFHSFIYINLSLFFLQSSWNNTRVILLPIFMSSLSILRIDWISLLSHFHLSIFLKAILR